MDPQARAQPCPPGSALPHPAYEEFGAELENGDKTGATNT